MSQHRRAAAMHRQGAELRLWYQIRQSWQGCPKGQVSKGASATYINPLIFPSGFYRDSHWQSATAELSRDLRNCMYSKMSCCLCGWSHACMIPTGGATTSEQFQTFSEATLLLSTSLVPLDSQRPSSLKKSSIGIAAVRLFPRNKARTNSLPSAAPASPGFHGAYPAGVGWS